MKNQINIRFIVLLGFVLLAGIIRLTNSFSESPIQNFTPLGAMALFGGSYFTDRWKAYLMPLLTLWLSDIVLNRFLFFGEWVFFYDGFLWVYGTFALIVLLGTLFIKKVTIQNVLLAAIVASLTHWVVTDFGVWLGGGTNPFTGQVYPKTLEGYWVCLVAALPFLKNFFLGTAFYSTLLFGGYELAKWRFPVLQVPAKA
ncbi:MAG: hypothetical protein H7Y04_10875 [Verrucomicrobia bacterium]|nr:hypothetical protein [Cytophagales bacterium]